MNFLRTYTQLLRQNTISVLGYFVPLLIIAAPLEAIFDNPFQHDLFFFVLVAICFYSSLGLTLWFRKDAHNPKNYAKQGLRLLALALITMAVGSVILIFYCLAPNSCLPTSIAGMYIDFYALAGFGLIFMTITFVEALFRKSP